MPEIFSLDSISKILHPIKSSSENTYEGHYKTFLSFIQNRYGVNNCFPLKGIVEFFNYLANNNYLSTTLKSVRSVLREPLKLYFPNYDILADPWIEAIIRHVRSCKIRPSTNFPSWDLDLVVSMLGSRDDRSIAYTFKKTLFIAFIACPYRIAEFRAISLSSSSFSPEHALLKPHAQFCSKNQIDTFNPSPIVIQAFPDKPEICPVSLLNAYINLTSALCRERGIPRPDQLWLNTNLKPLSLNSIRCWVREIIFLGDPRAELNGTHTHSVRGQVSSHLLAAGVPIKEIISAMSWRSSSTFSRYYAKLGIRTAVRAVLAGHLPAEV